MVKPSNTGASKKPKNTALTIQELMADKSIQRKALQTTANKWSRKYGFKGDLTIHGKSETGKSVILAVDGKPTKSKYLVRGTKDNPYFLSSKAIFFAQLNR